MAPGNFTGVPDRIPSLTCQVCGQGPAKEVGLRFLCAAHEREQLDAWERQRQSEAPKLCTTNGKSVADVRANQKNETGQHDGYIVLCPDERAKGFVRPYRDAYKHVGRLVEIVHEPSFSVSRHREGGCGTVTTMGRALSETYARDPSFYGATFCVTCNKHLPVSEFVWTADNAQVGS